MPRKPPAPPGSASTRHWRYIDAAVRVLTGVRRIDGSTLVAHPGGVYELHADHDTAEFEHPLLTETDQPVSDPAVVETPEPEEPADGAGDETPSTDPDPDAGPAAGNPEES